MDRKLKVTNTMERIEINSFYELDFLEVDGKRFELIEFPKLQVPHVALEYYIGGKSRGIQTFLNTTSTNYQKGYHILKFGKGKTQITFVRDIILEEIFLYLIKGRATESDLRVNDSTVSRTHAAINFADGEFYLQDLESKFGTLILADEPESLIENFGDQFTLEVGGVLIECKVKGHLKRLKRMYLSFYLQLKQIFILLAYLGEIRKTADKRKMRMPLSQAPFQKKSEMTQLFNPNKPLCSPL